MKKMFVYAIVLTIFLTLGGCGGDGPDLPGFDDDDHDNDSGDVPQGPMAGTWVGKHGGVTYTFTFSGRGPGYNATWNTSNNCFNSSNCSGQHISSDLGMVCKDTVGYQHVVVNFQGTFDGVDTLTGHLVADICDAHLVEPFIVKRQ